MGIDMGKLKERFDKKSAERVDRLNLKDGVNYLRLLPPDLAYLASGVDYIAVDYLMHFKLGTEGNSKSACCPRTHGKDKKCPICEAVWSLYKTKNKDDENKAKDIRAKTRHLFNVIDLNDTAKGIQVLEVGPKVYEKIVLFVTNPKYGDLLDMDKGRNIELTKLSEKETNTGFVDYDVLPDPDVSSVRAHLPANWKDVIASLRTKVPPVKSYDELKAILYGEEIPEAATKPVIVATPAAVTEASAPVVATPVAVASKVVEAPATPAFTGEKPKCFGTDAYGPRRDECVACPVRRECVTAFLN